MIWSGIGWGSNTYFLQITLDDTVVGVSQLLSVPYALYARSAETANSYDYNNLTNAPPVITQEQRAKLDNISVTSSVDLNQLESDVATNAAKEGFPGFGTVPGTALEGGTDIWSQSGNDIFYNTGKVGINVLESSDFGASQLHVGGGIRLSGINVLGGDPIPTGVGHLFYINDLSGGVLAYNADGGLRQLTNSNAWSEVVTNNELGTTTDIFAEINVFIDGGMSVGSDAVAGEDLTLFTVKLTENNTRLMFDDTDDPAGGFPSNDWALEANDRVNGGANYFAINDVTAGTQPFRVTAGAPDNSFFVANNGNVGLGIDNPSVGLEVSGNVKAAAFIGDGSGLTGITGGTGGISNTESTTIGADTDMNGSGEIALQTAGVTRVTITKSGNVGIGELVPSSTLQVGGSTSTMALEVSGNANLNGSISFRCFY